MSNTPIISKNMPQKFGFADGGNSFAMGRKAFANATHISHLNQNLAKNNSSMSNPKPLPSKSSDLRTQRLRMSAIGGGSTKLSDNNDSVSFKQSIHVNVVNNARTRVRGAGGGSVPKKNSITH
tara:strand:- start:604 stop:972 length:369 start_codon:yes stop_codon:yes gene_type:complete